MSATIERSLYIGILKSRFDIFDQINLILRNGDNVKGIITEIEDNYVVIEAEEASKTIYVRDIEDYRPL